MGAGGKLERCDTTEQAFAGFAPINKAATTATADGSPFYQQIFIPETIRGVPEAITVRYPWSKNQWFLFEPTLLPHLPDLLADASGGSRSVLLRPAGDPDLSTFHTGFGFTRSEGSDSATTTAAVEWEVLIRGLVTIPTSPQLGDTHRCVAAVGTLAVTRFEGFDLTTPPLKPELGLMIDGRRVDPSPPQACDTSGLRKLGYQRFGTRGDPTRSAESFYQTFALATRQADNIQAIVAGSMWFSVFRFYEPTILPAIPAV